MTVLRKQTPVRDLPRFRRDPVVEAERQGFDDGYFGNLPMHGIFPELKRKDAYALGFKEGKQQRESADRATARKAKK